MVSHTIMTIIQCMIMAYVLTIGQVQTLQPEDASLSRATCGDDNVLTKSSLSLAERMLLQPSMTTSFLNACKEGGVNLKVRGLTGT